MNKSVIPDWPLIFWRMNNNVTEGWTKIRGVEHALASRAEFDVAKQQIIAVFSQKVLDGVLDRPYPLKKLTGVDEP